MIKDTIIFDLDGTLLDTLDDLAGSVNYALRTCGFPEKSKLEIRRLLGNGVRYLVRGAVPPSTTEEAFEHCFAIFKRYYMEHCLDQTRPYDGIIPLLAQLKDDDYKMAIVSNKLQPAVSELREKFFKDYIDVAIGESADVKRKPAPDSVLKALDQLYSTKETAVYVGDSEVDMETAKNAGLPCISVLWGFRDRDFLEARHAAHMVASPYEVAQVVKRL